MTEEWFYVTTDKLADGGKVVLGPFATIEGAFQGRAYIERLEGHSHYWIETVELVRGGGE